MAMFTTFIGEHDMREIINVFAFTGHTWVTPDINTATMHHLLANHVVVVATILIGSEYYLLTDKDITDYDITITAKNILMDYPVKVKLTGPAELISSKHEWVTDAVESHGTVMLPSEEQIIINGGKFIPTTRSEDTTYSIGLTGNMGRHKDPTIATLDIFRDCKIMDITKENVVDNYINSVLLIGGILYSIDSVYTLVGDTVRYINDIRSRIPFIYKNAASVIPPHEAWLPWPITKGSLKQIKLLDRLLSHRDSRLIVIDSPHHVSCEFRKLSSLFSTDVDSVICYDRKPSPERVIKILTGYKCPDKYGHRILKDDLLGRDDDVITFGEVPTKLTATENVIKFIKYEVE